MYKGCIIVKAEKEGSCGGCYFLESKDSNCSAFCDADWDEVYVKQTFKSKIERIKEKRKDVSSD